MKKICILNIPGLIVEILFGCAPVALMYYLSPNLPEFTAQLGSYIPNHALQALFAYYFLVGLVLVCLANIGLNFSRGVLQISFVVISAFVALLQAFAGISLFFIVHTLVHAAFSYLLCFAIFYTAAHVTAAYLTSFIAVNEPILLRRAN